MRYKCRRATREILGEGGGRGGLRKTDRKRRMWASEQSVMDRRTRCGCAGNGGPLVQESRARPLHHAPPPFSQRTKINGRRAACVVDLSLHTLPPPSHEGRASRVGSSEGDPPRVGGRGGPREAARALAWTATPGFRTETAVPAVHHPRAPGEQPGAAARPLPPASGRKQERSAPGGVWCGTPVVPICSTTLRGQPDHRRCRRGGRPLRAGIAPVAAARPMEPDPGRSGDQNGLCEWPMRWCSKGRTNPRGLCATHRLGGSVGGPTSVATRHEQPARGGAAPRALVDVPVIGSHAHGAKLQRVQPAQAAAGEAARGGPRSPPGRPVAQASPVRPEPCTRAHREGLQSGKGTPPTRNSA